MNKKAEKFNTYMRKEMGNIFQCQEIFHNETHPVMFVTAMEVDNEKLPFTVVIDDSPNVMLTAYLAKNAANEENRAALYTYFNAVNAKYKNLKYYVDDDNNAILEACVFSTDKEFVPGLVHVAINIMSANLQAEYKNLKMFVA